MVLPMELFIHLWWGDAQQDGRDIYALKTVLLPTLMGMCLDTIRR